MQIRMRHLLSLSVIGGVAALGGCGGGGGTTAVAASAPPPPPVQVVMDNSGLRGALVQNPPTQTASLDSAGLQAQLVNYGSAGALILAAAGGIKCGVEIHHFVYSSVGAAGEPTNDSGALMVPTGSDPACSGSRPIVMYGHGSSELKNVDMTDLSPAAPYGDTSITAATLFAAQGYIVVAPNYSGYDTSTLSYHPHHIADQQSKNMIDALVAARKALPKLPVPIQDNGKLFLTGYSEGGYVTMATHRAMQAAGITVTAAAPQSGNYAESVGYEQMVTTPAALNDLSSVDGDQILKYAMQFTAWQKAFGNVYASPTDIYPAAYAGSMETVGPTLLTPDILVNTGKLPRYLLANDMPNYAGLTAAQKAYFGTPDQSLIKTSYITAVIADAAAHPCPVTSPTAPLDCAPTHPMRSAWLKNDLRTWVPATPMLMCGGNGDPEVGFYNAQLAMAYFQSHGVAANLVTVLDVDSPSVANDPYGDAKDAFLRAKSLVVGAGGDPTTANNYHGRMAFAGCNIAARDFFSKF